MTILLSLQFYYEAENKERDDDDGTNPYSLSLFFSLCALYLHLSVLWTVDSDLDESDSKSGSGENGVQTVSLATDSTLTEHKAEIDRAVFLIENSKKHENIKTVDIAKFLVNRSCPFSVIEHAFTIAAVPMPHEVYEMTGVLPPKHQLQKRVGGKAAMKSTKMLGIGLHGRNHVKSASMQLPQSHSEVLEADEFWCPPDTVLAPADNDGRYQEALCQHDIRFCTINALGPNKEISSVLPSDKLDQQLRLRINRMAARSGNKTLSSDGKKVKNGKKSKWRKKFKGRSTK